MGGRPSFGVGGQRCGAYGCGCSRNYRAWSGGYALQLAEILADVVKVDVSIEMGDLVPIHVTAELNEVVAMHEAVKLTDVAGVVVAERDREVDPVQESGVRSQWSKL